MRLKLLSCSSLLLLGATLLGDPLEPSTQAAANSFAEAYNTWTAFRRQPGTIDAKELRAWNDVRARWHDLDKLVRY